MEEAAIRLDDMMNLWGEEDPVHPTPQAYENMATGLLEQVASKWTPAGKGDVPSSRGVKRPGDENLGRRPDWAAASVTAVARKSGNQSYYQRGGHRDESWGRQKYQRSEYQRRGDGDQSSRPSGSGANSTGGGGERRDSDARAERRGGSRPAGGRGGGGGRRGGWGGW